MAADQLNSNRRGGGPSWVSGWTASNRNAPVGVNVQLLSVRTLRKSARAGEGDPAEIHRNCAGGAVGRIRTERLRAAIVFWTAAGRPVADLHLHRESAGKNDLRLCFKWCPTENAGGKGSQRAVCLRAGDKPPRGRPCRGSRMGIGTQKMVYD